eukprot:6388562-Prymnesium_polylepis.1
MVVEVVQDHALEQSALHQRRHGPPASAPALLDVSERTQPPRRAVDGAVALRRERSRPRLGRRALGAHAQRRAP